MSAQCQTLEPTHKSILSQLLENLFSLLCHLGLIQLPNPMPDTFLPYTQHLWIPYQCFLSHCSWPLWGMVIALSTAISSANYSTWHLWETINICWVNKYDQAVGVGWLESWLNSWAQDLCHKVQASSSPNWHPLLSGLPPKRPAQAT